MEQAPACEHDYAVEVAGILAVEILREARRADPAAHAPGRVPRVDPFIDGCLLEYVRDRREVGVAALEGPEELRLRKVASVRGVDRVPVDGDLEPIHLTDDREATG